MPRPADWLEAFRLRTLPLALASIGLGAFLAADAGAFRWEVFALCALTTVFLQVLSNLANDYGDSVHGADSAERAGPSRSVQSGKISQAAMLKAVWVFSGLSLVSGLGLLYVSLSGWEAFLLFLGIGVLAIVAAITYTAGARPYGYAGLGDVSVLVFFGWVAVLGSYYLHAGALQWLHMLPATACGLMATAVLNLNNIRDIESDAKAGKRSLPVRMGRRRAVRYHWALLAGSQAVALAYVALDFQSVWQLLFVLTWPLAFFNARAVRVYREAAKIDPFLKQMALTTLAFVLAFGVGLLLG